MNKDYWNERYAAGQTGWDLGKASPPLEDYIKQLGNKDLKILLPGCGNGYEALLMAELGFTNLTVLDIAPLAVEKLQDRLQSYPSVRILCEDFFEHVDNYDLILEQTFFCALPPSMREQYVQKMAELLVPQGKLVGLLFATEFDKAGPPFGGTTEEYLQLFSPYFTDAILEPCRNSIRPRQGNELFVKWVKKDL
ncbi:MULTISPECIES: methyltransferase domain-containing protein [Bacteroidota]|uniref:Methyltransferase domain-containing protein n=1 Tax=Flectobacillus rivi TaxID=2984209 RepID=A0ABT6Z2L5_9BACT|nr:MULTISPECIES: methyltransferase domain-containing protein [Bacteroidota]MDI9875342.1 methyltransferase domain-containing protein [Flectobacillus rivi]NBB27327.1 methyltransferase domain-containing protein [Cellulophaga sp. BC115SP]